MAAATSYEARFPLGLTNYAAMASPDEAGDDFKPFVSFMNKSYLKFALTESPNLIHHRLDDLWSSAELVGDKDKGSIKFTVKDKSFSIDSNVLNEALGIKLDENEVFENPASNSQLEKFFSKIGYGGPILAANTSKWFPSD